MAATVCINMGNANFRSHLFYNYWTVSVYQSKKVQIVKRISCQTISECKTNRRGKRLRKFSRRIGLVEREESKRCKRRMNSDVWRSPSYSLWNAWSIR
ncbi:hypothetical protein T10_11956 [Trichinella papuae]|uniref:Uncharacterized protein n=1 Tax=Trichinella papuae TaxID=268474 RepID=A0A0V1N4F7_9BILA|nr:hypothetical protein T10_11956 [Trichinella papuae]